MQSMVQTFVLITLPVTQTQYGHTFFHKAFCTTCTVLAVGMLPVHASQGQINVRILEQHPREEVLYGRINQEWCIYDLQTHKCTHTYIHSHRDTVFVM